MYKHILIATDGSDLAALGLEHGLRLAASLAAQVTVITVTEPMDQRIVDAAAVAGVRDATERYEASVEKDLAGRFAAIRAAAEAQGVTVEVKSLVNASPAEAILGESREGGHDLIVMSSHGRRGLKRLLLGSQTAEVLAHAEVPVLVIRQ